MFLPLSRDTAHLPMVDWVLGVAMRHWHTRQALVPKSDGFYLSGLSWLPHQAAVVLWCNARGWGITDYSSNGRAVAVKRDMGCWFESSWSDYAMHPTWKLVAGVDLPDGIITYHSLMILVQAQSVERCPERR